MAEFTMPKHWFSTHTYRCYIRKLGPLTIRLNYSSSRSCFRADIVLGYDNIVCELFNELDTQQDDPEVMRMTYKRAKLEVQRWLKR